MEFMKKSQTKPKNPIELESYTVPTAWFEANLMPDLDHDYTYFVEGNVVSGLVELDVYNNGQVILLKDASWQETVTLLMVSPTEAMVRVARGLQLEQEACWR